MSDVTLRPYQSLAVRAVTDGFASHPSQLLVMATGTGKTTVFAAAIREWLDSRGRALVLVHREELLLQGQERVAEYLGIGKDEIGIERADDTTRRSVVRPRVVIGSVPTLCRSRSRLEAAFPGGLGPWLVVVDECHHAHADAASYNAVLAYFNGLAGTRVLGVTATPLLADGRSIARYFPRVAFTYGIADAMADGWLVPIEQRRVVVDGLDFSRCRTEGGDFHKGDLARALLGDRLAQVTPDEFEAMFKQIVQEEAPFHRVAAVVHQEVADRPTIVFCVSVVHALAMSYMLNRYRPGSAQALSGTTNKDERAAAVQAFKDGRLQFLVNVGLFLEGTDLPNAACVVMARPTQSLPLYTQVVGRILRPLRGVVDWPELADSPERRRNAIARSGKPFGMILDFAGNAGKHRISDAVDLLAGDADDDFKDRVRRVIQEKDRPVPLAEAIDEARQEMDYLLDHLAWKRRRMIKAEAVYRTEAVPLVGAGHAHARPSAPTQRRADRVPGDVASPGQRAYLRRLGVPDATIDTYSKKQAGAVIDSILRRREREELEGRR